jgi:hypothetical protein
VALDDSDDEGVGVDAGMFEFAQPLIDQMEAALVEAVHDGQQNELALMEVKEQKAKVVDEVAELLNVKESNRKRRRCTRQFHRQSYDTGRRVACSQLSPTMW